MMRTLDDALFRFRQFQAELNAESAEDAEDGDAAGAARLSEPDLLCPRVSVADVGGGLTVDYRGSDYIGWDAFLGVLAALQGTDPNIASTALVGAARRLGIPAKSREVRGVDRVVIRDGDAIGAKLTRMGAHSSVLVWEERRMRVALGAARAQLWVATTTRPRWPPACTRTR